MRKTALVLALLFVGATLSLAQTTIDGSKHPEQIPDAVAFRMWSDACTSADADHENGYVHDLGMRPSQDATALTEACTDYFNALATFPVPTGESIGVLEREVWEDQQPLDWLASTDDNARLCGIQGAPHGIAQRNDNLSH